MSRITMNDVAVMSVQYVQYTFPYYPNYLPDHMQRLEKMAQVYTEYGCKPVFFTEGILGNTAWDK
jgi:hypothetical protein